jgi:hypothetical protein
MNAIFESLIYYEIGKGAHDLPNVVRYWRIKKPFGSLNSALEAVDDVSARLLRMYRPSWPLGLSSNDHDHPGKAPSKEDLSIKIEDGNNLYIVDLVADNSDYDGHACFWEHGPLTIQGLNGEPVSRLLNILEQSRFRLVFACDRTKLIEAVADIYGKSRPTGGAHFLLPFHYDLRDVTSGMPIGLHADHLFGQDAGLQLMGREMAPGEKGPLKPLKHGGYHPPGVASYLQV